MGEIESKLDTDKLLEINEKITSLVKERMAVRLPEFPNFLRKGNELYFYRMEEEVGSEKEGKNALCIRLLPGRMNIRQGRITLGETGEVDTSELEEGDDNKLFTIAPPPELQPLDDITASWCYEGPQIIRVMRKKTRERAESPIYTSIPKAIPNAEKMPDVVTEAVEYARHCLIGSWEGTVEKTEKVKGVKTQISQRGETEQGDEYFHTAYIRLADGRVIEESLRPLWKVGSQLVKRNLEGEIEFVEEEEEKPRKKKREKLTPVEKFREGARNSLESLLEMMEMSTEPLPLAEVGGKTPDEWKPEEQALVEEILFEELGLSGLTAEELEKVRVRRYMTAGINVSVYSTNKVNGEGERICLHILETEVGGKGFLLGADQEI